MRAPLIASLLFVSTTGYAVAQEGEPPKVGEEADDFSLKLAGGEDEEVTLSEELENGPVVLLVLRGWPGYQCPICSRQVGQFVAKADEFAASDATVLLVYPGPALALDDHAMEFVERSLRASAVPQHFKFLVDPDYEFTNAWNLRWNAPRETAYPSTFVIGKDKKVKFAKVSKTHGDRSRPDEVLSAL